VHGSLTPDLLQHLPKLEEEDEFDGLTPEEINALVEKKKGASSPQ